MRKIEQIKEESKDCVALEIYTTDKEYKTVEALHTDTCKYADIDLDSLSDEQILDYQVITGAEYNNTILANTGETIQDGGWSLDDRIMVVVISNA